ncbi:ketosteroid isomerase-like protein [Pedobacter sp. CG_S7]|uniref:nuclear transport factor 2 family protein n=1 Tax=Pedobacter sp. CG_S7 TaxID=3143930 RepID=UPI0033967973
MKHSKKEIAELFSNGKFENIMDYLSDGIVWNVIGENIFEGKNAVKKNCEQTAEYFKTVETYFKINDILISENKVIVIGTAEFKRGGKRIDFISACDVYEFNEKNEIQKISSYCIPEKNT